MKSLHAAMLDADLFGRTSGGPTFAAWRTVAKALDGLPLDAAELDLFRRITGRTEAPHNAFREAYFIKPRPVLAGRCLLLLSACTRRCRTIANDWARARWRQSP